MHTRIHTRVDPGKPQVKENRPAPCTVVIFGALGDLAKRKLVPALYNLAAEEDLPRKFAVVGFNRDKTDDTGFRSLLKESTTRFSRRKPDDWEDFSS